MLINPIASGSSGNAYYISDGQSSLLLDAGIPLAQIQAGCGYKVSQLSGCLVTHGHGDHVKAAKALARMGVNIYTSQGTADMASLTGHRICTVRALESFRAGTFEVLPFDVEHDVPEPLGFLIRSTVTGEKVLYFTDTVLLDALIDLETEDGDGDEYFVAFDYVVDNQDIIDIGHNAPDAAAFKSCRIFGKQRPQFCHLFTPCG